MTKKELKAMERRAQELVVEWFELFDLEDVDDYDKLDVAFEYAAEALSVSVETIKLLLD